MEIKDRAEDEMTKILIVGKDPSVREVMAKELAGEGHLVVAIGNCDLIEEMLTTLEPEFVLLNFRMDGMGARKVRVAVCGDAIINLAWLQSGYIWKFNGDFFDAEAARKSIGNLLRRADVIIPGHGQPFFTSAVRLLRYGAQR